MTDREKLVELISKTPCIGDESKTAAEHVADHLIANGVTVKQMQRPLTVEEVRALPEVVWVEWSIGDGVEPKIPSGIERNTVTNNEYFNFSDDLYAAMSSYGRLWRCWAEKPTLEERTAAEWGK